jgi:hypothetical protein
MRLQEKKPQEGTMRSSALFPIHSMYAACYVSSTCGSGAIEVCMMVVPLISALTILLRAHVARAEPLRHRACPARIPPPFSRACVGRLSYPEQHIGGL